MYGLWRYLLVQCCVAWFFVVFLPIIGLWYDNLTAWNFLQTQINSIYTMSLSVILVLIWLDRVSKFPGQLSYIYILPVILISVVLFGLIFFLFRWQYSVYFLFLSYGVLIIFCFISMMVQRYYDKPKLALTPFGRCMHFSQLKMQDVIWVELSEPDLKCVSVNGIVADLSSPDLNEEWQRFLTQQTLQGMPVYNYLQVYESLTGRSPIQHLHENNLGSLLPSQSYVWLKRILDTLVIVISLPVVLPIMSLTMLAIRLESKGATIFVQERVGQGGKLFKMYKFRSMVVTSEQQGAKMASVGDNRITRVGKFIRKTRIDELPQFINVLKGEMSLIGPRPEQVSFVKQFEAEIPFYSYRHIVKPGITGWAQVTQGYAGNTDETLEKIQRDFFYIKNFSLTLDLLIVIKTIQTIITGFGAR